MSDELEFGQPRETDVPSLTRVVAQAFGHSQADAEQWLRDRVTMAEARVLRLGDEVVATAFRVPMGMFVGGVSVPQVGIAGVAVAPEARGRGLARRIMTETLRDMRSRGEHVSTLYSAAHPLYRSIGYESGGHLYKVRLPAGMIRSDDRGRGWRPYTPNDEVALKSCAGARASHVTGALDRGPYVWQRVFEPKQGLVEVFVADSEDGGIEAYCVYRIDRTPGGERLGSAAGWWMDVVDLGYAGGRGLDRLLGFLQGFSSVVGEVRFAEGPNAPLLDRLDDRRFGIEVHDTWMLRVVSLDALTLRGYPTGLQATVGLRVHGDVLEDGVLTCVLEVSGGRGRLRKPTGQEPLLDLHMRDLATLYTGMHSASQLVMAGRLEGCRDMIELADAAFTATGGPCMFDFF